MKRVFAAINEHQKNTLCHKLFKDVYSINQADVVEKMHLWAPLFVHLAMTFRDINQMFYFTKHPKNDKQKAINAHAEIDSTHWDMLKDDLKTLGLYDKVKNYGDAMNMIWLDRGAPIRNYMYQVIVRAQMCGDNVFLKIAALESGEATVKMFFNTTKYMADLYEKETGKKLHYFGNQHIDSEVDNAVDLSIFEQEEIDDETWNKSLYIIDAHFDEFQKFLDYKYSITFP
ncbi:hypothetical protein BTURTLESOX_2231 [bacterium endosymbiont of Bathymodiolus sp. 5 South]|jgi:hypothetical protein|nr:hypothetical protein [uncultured Gammaproteobacteria bacterium]SSC08131.1 hypothetical protein BTURTLESOX_2231 [bacterium endosymbiont of Bathymodiolus sp. 5 South]CAC9660696.1 hypothetical protein [uncultured Gammaproteobacteria bacterium]VVH59335.1 hypothetical protein BSPCLSOX_2869 [uncultured Gammaproteobacteria bacterium]VVH62224.1 hypothetical protein BSPWISOX_3039 [uncultured Gammaproteobacteria bacterium]